MKKICVDGRQLTKSMTGVGTFLQSSLKSLQKNKEYEIFILLPRRVNKSVDMKFADNVRLVFCPMFGIARIPRTLWSLLYVPFVLMRIKPDLYYSVVTDLPLWLPKHVKSLVVVHDVVNKEFARTMALANRLINKLRFQTVVRNADFLWANSEYTKGKVEQYYPKRKCSEIFVGCAIDKELFFRKNISKERKCELRRKYKIIDKFILFVGTLEPRKNLRFLLSLMPALYKEGIQLLVVGGKGWENGEFYNIVNSSEEIRQSTIFAGYVSNEELVDLYNITDCYVSTSLNEGFGMPQLEALSCGCPVVTSHNSAMIEVAKNVNGAYTVVGYDEREWVHKICEVVYADRPKIEISRIYDWDVIIKKLCNYLNV